MITSLLYLMITMAVEMILLKTFRFLEYRSVNDNILKCLNFLGNYSLTAGEITGVLGQVSKYMEEPLKGVMEECAYEAQMTGNSSTALLAMAEKVEHPKFKELARNLEISIRYMADLTTLVDSSRRSVREYLRTEEERKGMLREAAINMGLLAAMSVFALMTEDASDRCICLEDRNRYVTRTPGIGNLWDHIWIVPAQGIWVSKINTNVV